MALFLNTEGESRVGIATLKGAGDPKAEGEKLLMGKIVIFSKRREKN